MQSILINRDGVSIMDHCLDLQKIGELLCQDKDKYNMGPREH